MGRAAKTAVSTASALLLACATFYLARKPIATWLFERYLNQRGIESSIAIDRLSFSGIVARFRLGNPRAPDLTVERIVVTIAWQGLKPRITSADVYRPVLRMSFDGQALSFGTLQTLIGPVPAHAAPQPIGLSLPSPQPGRAAAHAVPQRAELPMSSPQRLTTPFISGTGPQITVRDALLKIATPIGLLKISGSGRFSGGELARACRKRPANDPERARDHRKTS